MPFFDFHIHPTLKTLFSHDDPANGLQKASPFLKIDTKRIPGLLRWCTEFDFIMSSQSNLDQLFNNDVKLFGFPLFIPDTALMNNDLVENKAVNSNLKFYIHKAQLTKLIKKHPFKNLLDDDLPTLFDTARFGMGHRKIVPLTKKSDFKENAVDQIHVFFTIEGLHTLCDQPNDYNLGAIKRNLDTLLARFPILSVTLTHLQQSDICNHAYAIQFINDDRFNPTKFGISPKGLTMLDHLRSKNILIDIKHMSLLARKRMYDIYETQGWNDPIICTHAGLTGISWDNIHRYIYKKPFFRSDYVQVRYGKPVKYGKFHRPAFNPVSLNLYDEDVLTILKSGGLLGLSLDKRILGFKEYENNSSLRERVPNNIDRFSRSEFEQVVNKNKVWGGAVAGGECQSWNQVKDGGEVDPMLSEFHLLYFMQQIAHIIVVAQNNNYAVTKALKQICLGSDFDGIINPIFTCDSMDELGVFKIQFKNQFVKFCKDSNVSLPGNFSINRFSDDLFYENGKRFVLNRLT